MDSSEKNVPSQTTRRTRRRKWPIWVAVGLVGFCLLLVIAWWSQNSKWDGRIQAELDRYRAAGQPVDPEDFDPPPTSDDDNAALGLKEAAAAIKLTPAQDELVGQVDPVIIADNLDEFRKIAEENSEVFELTRLARSLKGADWGIRLRSPIVNVLLPDCSEQKDLAKFLCSMAIYYHKIGDDTAATEMLRDALAVGRIQRKMPSLIPDLVAIAIEAIVSNTIEDIAVDLKIHTGGSNAPDAPSDVGREKIKMLIAELLDEEQFRKDGEWTYFSERALTYGFAQLRINGKSSPSARGGYSLLEAAQAGILKPLHKRDLFEMLQRLTAVAKAARESSWPEARKLLPDTPKIEGLWGQISHPLTGILMPSMDLALVLRFRSSAMRRMAGTALGIRLYEIDHGTRPTKLADLVPQYLPAVPKDPFAEDNKTITYLPNAPRPLLYSIGDNGIDQGGKDAENPGEVPDWRNFDIPFFLDAEPVHTEK